MRDIDELIEYVRTRPYLSETLQELIVARIDRQPERNEIEKARATIMGRHESDARQAWQHAPEDPSNVPEQP